MPWHNGQSKPADFRNYAHNGLTKTNKLSYGNARGAGACFYQPSRSSPNGRAPKFFVPLPTPKRFDID